MKTFGTRIKKLGLTMAMVASLITLVGSAQAEIFAARQPSVEPGFQPVAELTVCANRAGSLKVRGEGCRGSEKELGLVAPGGIAEISYCCDACPNTGSGDDCTVANPGDHDTCTGGIAGGGGCFLDCPCGSTSSGGTTTCHSCG